MTAIQARFKKEMDIILPYFATFASELETVSGAVASVSGQWSDYLANTSGLWKTKYDINNP